MLKRDNWLNKVERARENTLKIQGKISREENRQKTDLATSQHIAKRLDGILIKLSVAGKTGCDAVVKCGCKRAKKNTTSYWNLAKTECDVAKSYLSVGGEDAAGFALKVVHLD